MERDTKDPLKLDYLMEMQEYSSYLKKRTSTEDLQKYYQVYKVSWIKQYHMRNYKDVSDLKQVIERKRDMSDKFITCLQSGQLDSLVLEGDHHLPTIDTDKVFFVRNQVPLETLLTIPGFKFIEQCESRNGPIYYLIFEKDVELHSVESVLSELNIQPMEHTPKLMIKRLFMDPVKFQKQLKELETLAQIMDEELGLEGYQEIIKKVGDNENFKFDLLQVYLHNCHFYDPWSGLETNSPEDQNRRGAIYVRVPGTANAESDRVFATLENEKPDLVYLSKLLGVSKFKSTFARNHLNGIDSTTDMKVDQPGIDESGQTGNTINPESGQTSNDGQPNPVLSLPKMSPYLNPDQIKRITKYLLQVFFANKVGFKDIDTEIDRVTNQRVRKEGEGKYRFHRLTRCTECSKLFRGEEFVRKHILSKHPQVVDIKTETEKWNLWVLDWSKSFKNRDTSQHQYGRERDSYGGRESGRDSFSRDGHGRESYGRGRRVQSYHDLDKPVGGDIHLNYD